MLQAKNKLEVVRIVIILTIAYFAFLLGSSICQSRPIRTLLFGFLTRTLSQEQMVTCDNFLAGFFSIPSISVLFTGLLSSYLNMWVQ